MTDIKQYLAKVIKDALYARWGDENPDEFIAQAILSSGLVVGVDSVRELDALARDIYQVIVNTAACTYNEDGLCPVCNAAIKDILNACEYFGYGSGK